MLICVDGSGPRNTAEYFTRMQNSFVLQIYGKSPLSGRRYHRGPDGTGLLHQVEPAALVEQIVQMWDGGNRKVFMTGFSRGGATVINAAALLQQQRKDIEIEAMFLFDAVDRSLKLSNTKSIPANVKKCYHALRARHRDRFLLHFFRDGEGTGSRESFANCGLLAEGGPDRLIKRDFLTTHGGMGGGGFGERSIPGLKPASPNASSAEAAARARFLAKARVREGFPDMGARLTVAEEAMGTREVADWMSTWLIREGVCLQPLVAVTVGIGDEAHPQGVPRIVPAIQQA